MEALQLYTSQLWTPIEKIVNIRRNYINDKPYIKEFIKAIDIELQKTIDEKIESLNIKSYSGIDKDLKPLNKKIDFQFTKGKLYIVKGENGVGKSTLLYSILGLSDRYTGDIYINGKKLLKAHSYSDIAFNSADSFISTYDEIKEFSNLSSGQTRYNQIKYNLSEKRSLIIIDEPTNYLDEEKKTAVLQLIKDKLNPETIIIITTNDVFVEDFFISFYQSMTYKNITKLKSRFSLF